MMTAASCGAAVSWMLVALLLVSREALSLRHRLLPKTVQNSAPVRGYNYQTRFFDQKVWLRIHEVCAKGAAMHLLPEIKEWQPTSVQIQHVQWSNKIL